MGKSFRATIVVTLVCCGSYQSVEMPQDITFQEASYVSLLMLHHVLLLINVKMAYYGMVP